MENKPKKIEVIEIDNSEIGEPNEIYRTKFKADMGRFLELVRQYDHQIKIRVKEITPGQWKDACRYGKEYA